jgi:hypothetical protein
VLNALVCKPFIKDQVDDIFSTTVYSPNARLGFIEDIALCAFTVLQIKQKITSVRKHAEVKLNIQSTSVQYLTVREGPYNLTKCNPNRTVLKLRVVVGELGEPVRLTLLAVSFYLMIARRTCRNM